MTSSSVPSSRVASRAAHVGFDWTRLEDVLAKLREEVEELRAVAGESQQRAQSLVPPVPSDNRARLEEEVGDFLFTAVNVARFLGVDAESALRRTSRKFRRRFQWVERELRKVGKSPREATLAEMDALWERSKEIEEEIGQ